MPATPEGGRREPTSDSILDRLDGDGRDRHRGARAVSGPGRDAWQPLEGRLSDRQRHRPDERRAEGPVAQRPRRALHNADLAEGNLGGELPAVDGSLDQSGPGRLHRKILPPDLRTAHATSIKSRCATSATPGTWPRACERRSPGRAWRCPTARAWS